MSELGNKYNILLLRVAVETISSKMIRTDKKFSSFGKGTARWMFCICICRSHLFWKFPADIPWKRNPGLFLQEYVHPNASQAATMIALWKIMTVLHSSSWNFLSSHYVTCFFCQSLQIFNRESAFISSVYGNKLGKHTFL